MTDLDVKGLVERLRDFEQAYGEEFFRPLTKEERAEVGPVVLSLASAEMGRHLAQFFKQAADALEAAEQRVQKLEAALKPFAEYAAMSQRTIPAGITMSSLEASTWS